MKKILIIAAIIIFAVSAWLFYLNAKVLPVEIKSRIITGLESITNKKVLIGSVKFDIFKGLVLRDIIISDAETAIVNVKEASCSVFILPLLKKQVIIPRLTLEAPEIFVERRIDNSFNIAELFPKPQAKKQDISFILRRIIIKKGDVNFHDLTLEPLFKKELKDVDADIYLDIPAKVRFALKFNIQSDAPAAFDAKGEYLLAKRELSARIKIADISPKDFEQYYSECGFSFPEGKVSPAIDLSYKEDVIRAVIESNAKALVFSKEKLSAKLDAKIFTELHYSIGEKKLSYSGSVDILAGSVSGIETISKIDNIKGKVGFSNLGLSAGNMHALLLGVPTEAKLAMDDFANPILNIDTVSDNTLEVFQVMLKEAFGVDVPAELKGPAQLRLAIRYKIASPSEFQIKGSLAASGASASINNGKDLLEKVTGLFQFTPSQLSWEDSGFIYKGVSYRTSGVLTNFKTPGVQLKLASDDLAIDAVFAINDKLFNFSKFSGRYLNSTFSFNGSLDLSGRENREAVLAEMSGVINLDPEDLKEPLKKFKDKLDKIKAKGDIRAELDIKGNIKDVKSCAIDAKLSSEDLSLYDMKLQNTTMNYSQKYGIGNILFMKSFLYGGSVDLTGRVEWAKKDIPYSAEVHIDGLKLEKLKADTAFKDKDVAGLTKLKANVSGAFNDAERFKGTGRLTITNGKLWQLNLFRGLGLLLFTSDFENIIFKEGTASLGIENKTFFVDDLRLRSEILDLFGSLRIGFDKAVDGSIKVEFSDRALESGFRKNITTALGKYTMIKLGGTLKEPKYDIRPDLENIVESIMERFQE